jgi:hypothetical protein
MALMLAIPDCAAWIETLEMSTDSRIWTSATRALASRVGSYLSYYSTPALVKWTEGLDNALAQIAVEGFGDHRLASEVGPRHKPVR